MGRTSSSRHAGEVAALRIEDLERKLDEAVSVLIFYGSIHADKDKSPWNVYSEDFGDKARNFISKLENTRNG